MNDRNADDRLISRLYDPAASGPSEEFRRWALQQMQAVLPFDRAIWGCGTAPDWKFLSVTLLNLPPDFPDQVEAARPINPLTPLLMRRINVPHTPDESMPDAEFFRSQVYRQLYRPLGISRVMSILCLDPRSGIYSLIALYRHARKSGFDADEKARYQRLAFHLTEATSHAFFLRLHLTREGDTADRTAAIVDRAGWFHQTQPRFLDLLEQHGLLTDPPRLPFTPPAPGKILQIGSLCAQSQPFGDLHHVTLRPSGPLDRLTERERAVVAIVTRGLSFKEVGRQIGAAPSTVSNHLYRIYRKLGIHSRSELARHVRPED